MNAFLDRERTTQTEKMLPATVLPVNERARGCCYSSGYVLDSFAYRPAPYYHANRVNRADEPSGGGGGGVQKKVHFPPPKGRCEASGKSVSATKKHVVFLYLSSPMFCCGSCVAFSYPVFEVVVFPG